MNIIEHGIKSLIKDSANLKNDLDLQTKAILKTARDYSKKTSIHGIQYIGEYKRNPCERCLWIFILIAALILCGLLILDVFEKQSENPVLISLESKTTSVWEIPFPAITICPNKQFSKADFEFISALTAFFNRDGNFYNYYRYELSILKTYLETVGQICWLGLEVYEPFNQPLSELKTFNESFEMSYFLKQINKLYHKRYDDPNVGLSICVWGEKKDINCFNDILTKLGYCKTFNILSPQQMLREEALHSEQLFNFTTDDVDNLKDFHWDTDFGFKIDLLKETYPKRTIRAGIKNGLKMLFTDFKNDDYDKTCKGPTEGFQVLLHSPYEFVDISNQFIQIPIGQQVLISIKPKIMLASTKLIKYAPEVRQCFFHNERYLRYFKTYNRNNCQMECLTNYTLSRCGCVKYYMPRNISTPICGLPKWDCCENAEKEFIFDEYSSTPSDGNYEETEKVKCNCLPCCTSISYDTEVNVADFNINTFLIKGFHHNNFNDSDKELLTKINKVSSTAMYIYFKEDHFLTYKRSELFTTTDLIAQCGGLLGLFMGFSMISFIEILYFFTFRLFVKERTIKNCK